MAISLVGVNPFLANLIQTGAIERMIKEALVNRTVFRTDVTPEEFRARIGETKIFSRSGLMPVALAPLVPGFDPTPKTYATEAFSSELQLWADALDMYLLNDYAAVMKESSISTTKIGINAAQTLDRLVRRELFQRYLGGNTVTTVLAAIGAVQIHVASLAGFTEINSVANGRPEVVSAANPLAIAFGGPAEPNNTVTAFVPDDPAAPVGPGWLTLGAALTAGVAAREAVLAANRSNVIFVGGGNSVDAIGPADTLDMTSLVNAVTFLRGTPEVPTFGDGFYHAHVSPAGEGQLMLDPDVRDLLRGQDLPDIYRRYAIGALSGTLLLRNAECPNNLNSGALVSSGAADSFIAPEVGGEVINNAGIRIGYTLVYGHGHCYEEYMPPGAESPEASIDSVLTSPSESSSGIALDTNRIAFILRPPLDRLNLTTSLSWRYIGDFVCASDITTATQRYRRACVIAHAIG